MFGAGNSKKNYCALLEEEDSTRRVIKEAGYIEASEYLSTSTGSRSYPEQQQRRSKSVARTKDTTALVNKDAQREPRSKSLSRKLEADNKKNDSSPPPSLNDKSDRSKKKRGSDSSKTTKPKQRRSSKFPSNQPRRGSQESQDSHHHQQDGTTSSQSLHDDGYHTDEETLFSGSVVQRQAVVDTIASPSTSRASKVLKSKRSASDKKDASSTATSTTATTAASKKTHGSSSSGKDKERRRARSESVSKNRQKVPGKTGARRSESVAAPKTRPSLLSTKVTPNDDDEGVGSTHTSSQLSLLDNISVSDIIDSHHILERMKNDSALKLTDRWESVPVLMPFPDKDKTAAPKDEVAETSEAKLQSKKEQTDKPRASNEGSSRKLDTSDVDKAANRKGRKERSQPEEKAAKERRRGESKNRERKEGSQKESSSPRRPRKSSSVPRTGSPNRDSSRPRSTSHSRSLSRSRTDSARRMNSSSKPQGDLERTLHQSSISNRADDGDSVIDAESFAGTEPKEAEAAPQQKAEPALQQKPKRRSLLALVEKLYGGDKSLRKVMNDGELERGRSSREMNMRSSSLSPSRSDREQSAERTRDGLDAVHHGGDKRVEMKSQSENYNSTRRRDSRAEMGSQSESLDHTRRRDSNDSRGEMKAQSESNDRTRLRDSRRRLLDNAMDVPLSRQAEARSRRGSIEKNNLSSISAKSEIDSSKNDKKKASDMDSSERRKSDKSSSGDMDSSLSKSVTFDLHHLPNESESNQMDNSEGSYEKSDSENSGKEDTKGNRLSKSVALNPKQRRRKRNNVASETLHKSLNSIGSSSDIDEVQMHRMHASEHSQFGFTPLPTVPEQAWQRRRRKSTSTEGS